VGGPALRLSERDLKMMNRLVRAQVRRLDPVERAAMHEPLVAA
jgi:hypothetical protein